MNIVLPFISILAIAIIVTNMLLLYRTSKMDRMVVTVYLLARLNWVVFFLFVALGLFSNLEVILFTGLSAILFLFTIELLMMAVSILGDKHGKSE